MTSEFYHDFCSFFPDGLVLHDLQRLKNVNCHPGKFGGKHSKTFFQTRDLYDTLVEGDESPKCAVSHISSKFAWHILGCPAGTS